MKYKDDSYHKDSGIVEWYTPGLFPSVYASTVDGKIDLDPASSDAANKIVKATTYYTADDNGLNYQWKGRVWVNHPYGRDANRDWSAKIIEESYSKDVRTICGICWLSSGARWFDDLVSHVDAICLISPRVWFINGYTGEYARQTRKPAVLYYFADGYGVDRWGDAFDGYIGRESGRIYRGTVFVQHASIHR